MIDEHQYRERRSFFKWCLLSCSALLLGSVDGHAFTEKKPRPKVITLKDDSNVLTDVSQGDHYRLTPTQHFTLDNPINGIDGQKVVWEIIQDSIGGRQISLGDKFILGTDLSKLELTKTPRKCDYMTAIYKENLDQWHVVAFIRGF